MKELAKVLYGSQNYGLSTEQSDEDYTVICAPEFTDLLPFNNCLNKEVDEHTKIMDVRKLYENVKKQKFSALELIFSSKVEFYDEDFKVLFQGIQEEAQNILRQNPAYFFASLEGLLTNTLKNAKMDRSKAHSRCQWGQDFLTNLLHDDLYLSEETFRGYRTIAGAQKIRLKQAYFYEDDFKEAMSALKEGYKQYPVTNYDYTELDAQYYKLITKYGKAA